MTTIAYKDGLMVGDKQMGGDKKTVTKIFRINDDAPDGYAGALLGMASSDFPMSLQVLDWLNGTAERPDLKEVDRAEFLVALPDGTLQMAWKELLFVNIENPFWAIGSGGEYALGAMEMGGSAADAVGIAHAHDGSTGAAQTHLYLHHGADDFK